MNDAVPDRGNLAVALGGAERDILVFGNTLGVNIQIIHDSEPWVLLIFLMQLSGRISAFGAESDQVTWDTARRRHDELDLRLVRGLSHKDHTVGGEPSEFLGSEVAKDNDHGALHSLEGDELLHARGNFSDLTISDVNFLAIEFDTVWVFPALDDFADTHIHLSDVRSGRCGSRLALASLGRVLLLLLLLLLRGLFGLFAFTCCGTGSLLGFLLLLLLAIGGGSTVGTLCLVGFRLSLCFSFGHLLKLRL